MRTAGQISRINKTKWGVGGDPRCDALRQHANIQTLLHKPVPQRFGVMALLRLAFVADSTCQPSCQMGPGGYPERWGEVLTRSVVEVGGLVIAALAAAAAVAPTTVAFCFTFSKNRAPDRRHNA